MIDAWYHLGGGVVVGVDVNNKGTEEYCGVIFLFAATAKYTKHVKYTKEVCCFLTSFLYYIPDVLTRSDSYLDGMATSVFGCSVNSVCVGNGGVERCCSCVYFPPPGTQN